MIKVSETAAKKIRSLMDEEGKSGDPCIRVSVEGGGCSGLMYNLSFEVEKTAHDQVFESQDVAILVDKKSILYLVGTTLEFSGGLNGKGFHFVNPNASRTCGCGESFSV